jgi:hypothetical protein
LVSGYVIQARGGNGTAANGAEGNAMGGGGGCGGNIIIICHDLIGSTSSIDAAAGLGGAGYNAGIAGLNGIAGGIYIIRV